MSLEDRIEDLCERLDTVLKAVDGTLESMEVELVEELEVARILTAPSRLRMPETDQIIEAMLELNAHECPLRASQIADVLWHGEHGHGDLIRLGQRLGMMSSVGLVVRTGRRGRYGAHSWALPKAAA